MRWENEAYAGGYGADWLEDVGEAVKNYALNCANRGKTPTFKGLIQHIQEIKMKAEREEAERKKGRKTDHE